jgi:putative FmdB family regulatory protein
MPIFEYECATCGHEFEELVLPSSPEPRCPSCGGHELRKVLSLPSVSSEQTRERSLKGARERAGKVRKEKDHEEHKWVHKHIHHDH